MDLAKFRKKPILGILRDADFDQIAPVMETVISAGLETIEITMNTRDAAKLIKEAVKVAGRRIVIGAGTVLDMGSLKTALDSGAAFIVTPVLTEDITKYCARKKIPIFPGALTPLEIYNAWNAGATMVKVFPSGLLRPAYLKEIKGPFKDIELLACGGVTPENLKSYFLNGASAVAFGGCVFSRERLLSKDFAAIGRHIREYVSAYSEIGKKGL